MPETKVILENLDRDFQTYRDELDELVKAMATSSAVAEIDAKLDRINAAMDANSEALEAQRVNQAAKNLQLQSSLSAAALAGQRHGGNSERDLQARQLLAWSQNVPLRDVPPGAMSVEDLDQYNLDQVDYMRTGRVTNLLSSGGDPVGGYLIDPDTSGGIIQLVRERSMVRMYADVRTTGSNRVEGRKRLDDIGYGWVAERAARDKTATSEVGQWAINVHDLYAQPDATQDEIDDAFVDIGAMLVTEVGDKFARVEGEAFVKGTGSGQPRGFTTYPLQAAATAVSKDNWGSFRKRTSGAAATFPTTTTTEQALIDLVHDLKPPYLANARWYLKRSTLGAIRKIIVANVGYVFMGNFREDSPWGDILGYPVATLEDMNGERSSGTGDFPLVAFGDMRAAYRIYDRQGIRILIDPYTAKPNVNFYCTRRLGADVVNFDSLVFLSQEA